jgi:endothelin-converting enzyme/putative endopeptidase
LPTVESKPYVPKPSKPPEPTLAGVYLEDIDKSADPCNDFFEFANGAWRKANPIPASQVRWSRRWQSGETAKERLKDILEPIAAKSDWKAGSVEQQLGDFYGACMDAEAVDALGSKPIEPLLADIAAIKDRNGIRAAISKLSDIGLSVPFAIVGDSDLHTPNDVVAHVYAGGLRLPDRDYYVKPEKRFADARAQYLLFIDKMFGLAGRKDGKAAAKTVMAIETALAKASLDNVALRDPKATDHKMTVAELQKLSPSFDWSAYLAAAKIPANPLNVTEPAFIKEFEARLKQTSIADWKTYLSWHVIGHFASSLSQPFVEASFEFNDKYLNGTQELKPRWKRCAEGVDRSLGDALGQKYVEKFFPPIAKQRMKALVDNVLAAMKDTIEKLDWMSATTKAKALEKLSTVNTKIGYPDKWKDYSAITIKRSDAFGNRLAATAWNVADNRSTIGKPIDRGRWGMTPPTSNAYYNPSLNEIVFPAGILQPPIFRVDAVDAYNYGAIGVIIGHEISHGFDDQGAQFDAQGRLANWWTPDDLKAFKAKGQCVVDQYNNYFIEPNIHHDGKLVLGEAIGDSGGVNLGWRAFQKAQQTTPAPTIDGYTPAQQFFIAWGQARGDATRIETQRTMVQGDPHAVAKWRVIGPMSHLSEFHTAFSCKAGTPMVVPTEKRCTVW